jgi:hypothetical protein
MPSSLSNSTISLPDRKYPPPVQVPNGGQTASTEKKGVHEIAVQGPVSSRGSDVAPCALDSATEVVSPTSCSFQTLAIDAFGFPAVEPALLSLRAPRVAIVAPATVETRAVFERGGMMIGAVPMGSVAIVSLAGGKSPCAGYQNHGALRDHK